MHARDMRMAICIASKHTHEADVVENLARFYQVRDLTLFYERQLLRRTKLLDS